MRTHLLHGRIRCQECRRSWPSSWRTDVPALLCQECGGECVPEGPQCQAAAEAMTPEAAIDAEMWQLECDAVLRTMS